MKKQIFKTILLLVFSLIVTNIAFAEEINLTIRNGTSIVFDGIIPLQPAGNIELEGHSINANSVLSVLNDADISSSDFSISDLEYYDSFGSFYVKCIDSSAGNDCDNWQYVVDNDYPETSVDQEILSGGESVYFYFGPQNRIILSDEEITTEDTLIVTAEEYDYENNGWLTREGVVVGITQPNQDNPWTPIEIRVDSVDANGQASFSNILEGSYNVGIQEDFYFPTETLTVITAPEAEIRQSSGSSKKTAVSPETIKPVFDVEQAVQFLLAQQKEDGSFGEDLYTDWIALALAQDYQNQTIKLTEYFKKSKIDKSSLTDYERRSMALLALGLNPYNFNEENYIEKIITEFDGKQFGDPEEDNDDIFALIVLQNVGYNQNDKIISNALSFILEKQKENGSWDESLDMTGAAMEALSIFREDKKVDLALIKAKEFLKQNQKENSGWENVSSTAWVLEGIVALGEKAEDWKKGDNTPLDYLAMMQDNDGGIKNENIQNKIWETAYVVSILSDKTWNQRMSKFEKPTIVIEKPKVPTDLKIVQKIEKRQALEATTINALSASFSSTVEEKKKNPNKNWLWRFLDRLFSIF